MKAKRTHGNISVYLSLDLYRKVQAYAKERKVSFSQIVTSALISAIADTNASMREPDPDLDGKEIPSELMELYGNDESLLRKKVKEYYLTKGEGGAIKDS